MDVAPKSARSAHRRRERPMSDAGQFSQRQPLPVGSAGKLSTGWWGILALIVTEASLFGYLLFAYFYLASQTEQPWPPEGLPALLIPSVNTAILLASSACVWAGERYIRLGQMQRSIAGLVAAIALGQPSSCLSSSNGRRRPTISIRTCMDRSTLRSQDFTCVMWLLD